MSKGKLSIFVFTVIFSVLCIQLSAEVYDEKPIFEFDGRDWVAGFAHATKDQQVVEYVLSDESIEDWSELLTVTTYPVKPESDVLDFQLNFYLNSIKEIQKDFTWEEKHRTENIAIKEFVLTPTNDYNNYEYTIGAFIKGNKAIHMILYASHSQDKFNTYKDKWIESFKNITMKYYEDQRLHPQGTPLGQKDRMLFMEVQNDMGHSDRYASFLSPKKLWRCGTQYGRVEEKIDHENEMHLLYIVDEPDIWLINNYIKKGQHSIDDDPEKLLRLPVFGDPNDKILFNYEFGMEQKYFDYFDARQIADETVDGVDCSVYELTRYYWIVRLYIEKEDNLPYKTTRTDPNFKTRTVYYDQYNPDLPLDLTLFEPPHDVKVVEK